MNSLAYPTKPLEFLVRRDELSSTLTGMLGQPWDEDPSKGWVCWRWVRWVYAQAGIALNEDIYVACRSFVEVPKEEYWVPFNAVYFTSDDAGMDRHIGIMWEWPWLYQCSKMTNGIAKVSLLRQPWKHMVQGVYRFDWEKHEAQ